MAVQLIFRTGRAKAGLLLCRLPGEVYLGFWGRPLDRTHFGAHLPNKPQMAPDITRSGVRPENPSTGSRRYNYITHKTPAIKRWLQRHQRYHLPFTPTHISWINQVERWFALLSRRALKRNSHHTLIALESAIKIFIEAHNEDPKPFQ